MNEFVYRQLKEINRFSFFDMFYYGKLSHDEIHRGDYRLSNHVTMVIGNNQVTFFNDKTNSFGKAKIHKDDIKNKPTLDISIAIAWARYKGEFFQPFTISTACSTKDLKVGDIFETTLDTYQYKVVAIYQDGIIYHIINLHHKPIFSPHFDVLVNRNIF